MNHLVQRMRATLAFFFAAGLLCVHATDTLSIFAVRSYQQHYLSNVALVHVFVSIPHNPRCPVRVGDSLWCDEPGRTLAATVVALIHNVVIETVLEVELSDLHDVAYISVFRAVSKLWSRCLNKTTTSSTAKVSANARQCAQSSFLQHFSDSSESKQLCTPLGVCGDVRFQLDPLDHTGDVADWNAALPLPWRQLSEVDASDSVDAYEKAVFAELADDAQQQATAAEATGTGLLAAAAGLPGECKGLVPEIHVSVGG
jgi:hypothetical protein